MLEAFLVDLTTLDLETLTSSNAVRVICVTKDVADVPDWVSSMYEQGYDTRIVIGDLKDFQVSLNKQRKPAIIVSRLDFATTFWKEFRGSEFGNYVLEEHTWIIFSDSEEKLNTKEIRETVPNVSFSSYKHDELVEGVRIYAACVTKIAYDKKIRTLSAAMANLEKLVGFGELSGKLVHDVCNFNSVVIGSFAAIKKSVAKEAVSPQTKLKIEKNCERGLRGATRITEMADRLRLLLRPSDDPKETPKQSFENLRAVVGEAIDCVKGRALKQQTTIEMSIGGKIEVKVEMLSFLQCCINLLSNSLKAIKNEPQSWIKINAQVIEEDLCLFFVDSGNGISESIRNRVFDLFFTTSDLLEERNLGLGLSLVKKELEKQGILISCPKDTANTTFVITIPQKLYRIKEE